MSKKISVIMSVYNDEKYIEDAINSILNQSYDNFELIICNDCSTDKSNEIIQKLADQDSRILYIQNEINMGLAPSLNRCLKKATGQYIARMDSDDYSLEDRFEKQVHFLDAHPEYAVIGGQMNHMDMNGSVYKKSNYPITITKDAIVKNVCIAHPTAMIRKEVFNEVDGYTVNKYTVRAQDYDLWCKIAEKGYQLHNLEDVVLKYREDSNTIRRRKYIYRIDEANIKNYWRKRMGYPIWYCIYSLKPLIIGLLPSAVYMKLKRIK